MPNKQEGNRSDVYKEAMQQLGIIEPTPPPPPPLEQRDPATLTHDESREALRRLQLQLRHTTTSEVKQEAGSKTLKRERHADGDAETERPVKKERTEIIEIEDDD